MWLDIPQNEDDWLLLKAPKLTGSESAKVMANYGKAFGDPAKKLAACKAVAQLTGKLPISDSYRNADMDRGHEQEPIGKHKYEQEYFCTVTNGGFFDNGLTGCSPDGLIGDNGLIEIKSVIASVQYSTLKRGAPDPAYKWQLNFNLRESGREWIDYVSFCADFPEDKQLIVYRLYADDQEEEFSMIRSRVNQFLELVEEIKSDIQRIAA